MGGRASLATVRAWRRSWTSTGTRRSGTSSSTRAARGANARGEAARIARLSRIRELVLGHLVTALAG